MIDAAINSPTAIGLKPAAMYVRRSTDRQEQSLGDQRKEIIRWAEENGFEVVREFVDDALSGTTAKRRPGFQRMIKEAEKGEFVAVIVWNSDRFSRGDVTETEHFRYLLREAGVTVHSVTEEYVAKDGIDGDVLRAVKQFQNRQFSVSLSQNTLRGQVSSVLKSNDPGRMPPFGYDRQIIAPDGTVQYTVRFRPGGDREMRDRDGNVVTIFAKGQSLQKPGKECNARLVLSDESRVAVIRDIYRWCVEGLGFKQIADRLNRQGIMSPRGRLWQHTTIRELVKNPAYYGALTWNRRTMGKFYELRGGRADKLKPTARSGTVEHVVRAEWITIPNAVPAIVDEVTWNKAQAAALVRAERSDGTGKQVSRWLLSSVLKCGCCGSAYWGLNKTKGKKAGNKVITKGYYVCAGRCRCGKSVCPWPAHLGAADLEAWVLGELREMVMRDTKGMDDAIERFIESVRGTQQGDDDLPRHRMEIQQIERQVNALVSGVDPENVALINGKLTSLRQRKEFLQQQVRMAEASSEGFDEKALRRFATERIGLLHELMAGRRDEKARQVLASFVDEIVIEPETKTGYMAINAGFFADGGPGGIDDQAGVGSEPAPAPAHARTSANRAKPPAPTPQKPNNPPLGRDGSQVAGIAGARSDLCLRPPGRRLRRFRWSSTGVEIDRGARGRQFETHHRSAPTPI